jgi:hypothetical protein
MTKWEQRNSTKLFEKMRLKYFQESDSMTKKEACQTYNEMKNNGKQNKLVTRAFQVNKYRREHCNEMLNRHIKDSLTESL